MTIQKILDSYSFPNLFYVKYAVAGAKYAISFVDNPTPESLTAIDLAERYSLGEDIKPDALREASYVTYYTRHTASTAAAYHAVLASAAAIDVVSYAIAASKDSAYYAVSYAIAASKNSAKAEADLRALLLNLMDKEFTEFELLMMKD